MNLGPNNISYVKSRIYKCSVTKLRICHDNHGIGLRKCVNLYEIADKEEIVMHKKI